MIIWINGAFGAGKTQTAYELHRRIENSFVYDPENIGYFISKNIPKSMGKGDFQDHELWREFNFKLIKDIAEKYCGVLIIPMTIVNPKYFDEIVGSLRSHGITVNHYALMAPKETLLKRLRGRGDGANSWPAQQIDRCLKGLSNEIFREHLYTEEMSIDDVAQKIALMSGLNFQPDNRGVLRKRLSRVKIQLKHIRFRLF
jgi:hypothetical protein